MSETLDSSQTNAVRERYAKASQTREAELCCPVDYDRSYLEAIPQEVIERDYGCGDPSKYLKEGETVLDLGSGTGKICFIASQVVGQSGKVIGVDMTDDMLEVAERNAPIVAKNIGYANVEFRKGRIQDLALDLNALEHSLAENPVRDANDFLEMEARLDALKKEKPLVASNSIDVVVSNCVLNLVDSIDKPRLFRELFRVLKEGGRAVISDIVADEEVPLAMRENEELWSGCISGAMTESGFLKAFEDAGFVGIQQLKFEVEPWRTVEGIEFRSVTIEAIKPPVTEEKDLNQALIYNGPFKKVLDDEGNAYERGKRYAVSHRSAEMYSNAPYAGLFTILEPREEIGLENATPMDVSYVRMRSPAETKGLGYRATTEKPGDCSGDGTSCC